MANDPVASSTFNIFTDSVSVQYSSQFGNGSGSDLCGLKATRSSKSSTAITSLHFTSTSLQAEENQPDPTLNPIIGNNQFVLVTTLDNYGIKHDKFFNVNVSPCQIKGISAGNAYISAYTYHVNI